MLPTAKNKSFFRESVIDLQFVKIKDIRKMIIKVAESSLDKNKNDDNNPNFINIILLSNVLMFFIA